jgi:hypothetical protein
VWLAMNSIFYGFTNQKAAKKFFFFSWHYRPDAENSSSASHTSHLFNKKKKLKRQDDESSRQESRKMWKILKKEFNKFWNIPFGIWCRVKRKMYFWDKNEDGRKEKMAEENWAGSKKKKKKKKMKMNKKKSPESTDILIFFAIKLFIFFNHLLAHNDEHWNE